MMRMILIFLALLAPLAARAQTEGLAHAEILQGGRDAAGRPLAAIALTLQQGWRTYWRSPGEGGGIPPEFDWAGSLNLASAEVFWPAPEMWGDAGMMNIGYHEALVLPLALNADDPSKPVEMALTLHLGICKDICIPATIALTAQVTGDAPPHAQIAAALADQPQPAATLGAADIACTALPIKDGMQVTAAVTMPPMAQGAAEAVVVEHRDAKVWASAAQVLRDGDRLTAVVDLVPPSAKPFDLKGDDLRLTILTGGRAAEIIGCPIN